MKFSIIIATIDRGELLLKAIQSILKQTYSDFEILIIDQSERKNNEIPDDPRIVYIHEPHKGLSHARNIGINRSEGDIIGLMDDDAEYSIDVLENVNRVFEFDSRIEILSGRLVDPHTRISALNGMSNTPGRVNCWNVLDKCISSSLFIKRTFLVLERFDENFGIGSKWGSGEETDIILRCINSGGRVYYSPEVVVLHLKTCKRELSFEKLKIYSKGFGALAQKHKMDYSNYVFYLRCLVILNKQILGLLVSIIRYDPHMIMYYRISFKYKMIGMLEYRKERKK